MEDKDLPEVPGWRHENGTNSYLLNNLAALYNARKGTMSLGIYSPAGAFITEQPVSSADDIVAFLKWAERGGYKDENGRRRKPEDMAQWRNHIS